MSLLFTFEGNRIIKIDADNMLIIYSVLLVIYTWEGFTPYIIIRAFEANHVSTH